jgi:hypothetical protein
MPLSPALKSSGFVQVKYILSREKKKVLIFSLLIEREEILKGMLGANLIGFQVGWLQPILHMNINVFDGSLRLMPTPATLSPIVLGC